jgi:EAL domain-containing protein (putative c-di-GMP-specific phosphodiesterase class I)/ActR/RegA family two-component response regulator
VRECPHEGSGRDMTDTHAVDASPHQIVLLLDDDLMITEGLAAGLERSGRTIITCNDIESGELVMEWLRPSHVVTDMKLSGPFKYEGLDFIRFAKNHSPDTRIIVMTGEAPDALQLEASERGAVGFLQKPFDIADLDAVLDMMAPPRTGSAAWPSIIRMPLIDDIISSPSLTTVFQPIVRITDGDPVGYEALARFASESPLRDPETLFKYALRKGRLQDLEMACIARAIRAGAHLAQATPLFFNIHPAMFLAGRRLYDTVTSEAKAADVSLNRIVLEITEQGTLSGDRKVLDYITQLKDIGVRFAFDDVGVAYSHLPFVDTVRPSFLKISQQFGTGFETDSTRTKIVKNILSLASDFSSELILEGIETAETAAAALGLGIKYGQGYYYARPALASTFAKSAG